MKTVMRHEQKEDQEIRTILRQLFELHIELEHMNHRPHNYVGEVSIIIDSMDEMFERLMNKE